MTAADKGILDGRQDFWKSRPALGIGGWEICPGEKRPQIGGEENAHRPSPLLGDDLDGRHVKLIDVRALLAIHFDVDECPVHLLGNRVVFEAFAFHDVAPVAGAVSDGQKNRPILPPGTLQRFIAPGIPIHRIVRVLEEIRRCFGLKTIRIRQGNSCV
jgi:hypothetical protein